MTERIVRYQHVWPAESAVALWLTPLAALLFFGAWSAEAPLLIRLAIAGIALLALLLAGAALIKTSVTVGADGSLAVRKTMAGLPISMIRFDTAGIIRVELERRISPLAGKKSSGGSKSATPRFRLDIVHAKGKFFVVASTKGGRLKDEATELAAALHCPMQKVGD